MSIGYLWVAVEKGSRVRVREALKVIGCITKVNEISGSAYDFFLELEGKRDKIRETKKQVTSLEDVKSSPTPLIRLSRRNYQR